MTVDSRYRRLRVTAITVALSALPGALGGMLLGGLLFFLNPELPFAPAPVVSAALYYGLPLAVFSLLGHLVLTRGSLLDTWRLFPFSLGAVFAATASVAFVHASRFAFLLPPGINRRLLKLGLLVALCALAVLATGLLHTIARRAYSWRSKVFFFCVVFISLYSVVERRDAFGILEVRSQDPNRIASRARPTLAVVGLEAATFDVLLPLIEQGRAPFFARIRSEGVTGGLIPPADPHRSARWTTIATGKHPFLHGIVDDNLWTAPFLSSTELRMLPRGLGFEHWGVAETRRPVTASDRQAMTLWEILARVGLSVEVVGWPVSDPAPESVRVHLSDTFFVTGGVETDDQGPMIERARLFQARPSRLDPTLTARFGDDPPEGILDAVAQDEWRRNLAYFLAAQTPPPDALFVRLPGLEAVSEATFGAWYTIAFEGIQDARAEPEAQRLAAYYSWLDEVVAGLWEQLPEPRVLVIVAPAGSGPPPAWRRAWDQWSGRATTTAGPEGPGIIMIFGDGIEPGQVLGDVDPVDIVPTLLYALGLPVADDLSGATLTDVFDASTLARQPLLLVPSYEGLTETD
ncbi:MAG: alkaline phosphatase family protein [Acidobacteriota bacterium]